MIQISNEKLTVSMAAQGAELQHIVHRENGLEYLWSGDPAFWGKKSPVLFPIVGGLKNNTYRYNGETYTLGRHGFAREQLFTVTEQGPDHAVFSLTDSPATLQVYPFRFAFHITYRLEENRLSVTYRVENKDTKPLLFSVGAHPAFKVPLVAGTTFEDYYLHFNQTETAGRYPLSPGGQIELTPVSLLEHTQELPLQKALFYEDALVFKGLQSDAISIKSRRTPHGLTLYFGGFPYMGIWSAKDADFVCIEPWCGIADNVEATGELAEKEGINELAAGSHFERTWIAEFF
ncbi:aldose 1-epimerase family protein [Chitinophaga nivalis]|uniref:Aldose 1-epimerase family protein n=1 Tax=Chitinophaga nivalis TaxID=2991709 RepID=A0ABT3IHG3_9BACT|nr:aldose 1-epimerase family protein [Chitinophaga nivalis]MCW3466918.1 aldose 1-epimerase family protein [Chitinophaga nivalis]MCW3483391.1 aldose 1-epimerase family protein [Chitinophaga nivalis]